MKNYQRYLDLSIPIITFVMIFASAVFLRLKNLSDYYYNPDEAWFLAIASSKNLIEVLKFNTVDNAHPPLFPVLLHFMLKISDNVTFLRMVSVLPGIILLPLVFALGLRFIGRAAAVYLMLVTAFSYHIILLAGIVRQYSILLCLLFLGLWFILLYMEKRQEKFLRYYFVVILFALLTQYTAAIFIAAIGLAMPFTILKDRRQFTVWFIGNSALALVFAINYYVQIWSGTYGPTDHYTTLAWLPGGFPRDINGYWINFIGILKSFFTEITFFHVIALLTLPASFIALYLRKRMIFLAAFILAVGINIIISKYLKVYPFYAARHTIYLFPLMVVISAFGFQLIFDYLSKFITSQLNEKIAHNIQHSAILFVSVLLCFTAVKQASLSNYFRQNYSFCEYTVTKNDYNEIIKKLKDDVVNNDLILTEKQTAWYMMAELGGSRQIEKISPEVSKIKYDGMDVYYWDQLRPIMVSNRDFRKLVAGIKPLIPDNTNRVWFVGLGCSNSLMSSYLYGNPVPIAGKVQISKISPTYIGAAYSIDWLEFKKIMDY